MSTPKKNELVVLVSASVHMQLAKELVAVLQLELPLDDVRHAHPPLINQSISN